MLISYTHSQSSVILRVKILDSSVATGAGKSGLTNSSGGLRISTIADVEATATVYTAAGSTIETITTLGAYAAPSTNKCRFKEVDSTNHPGVYEIQLANSRFAVANCKSLLVSITGATGAADCDAVIPLTQVDPYDNFSFGLDFFPTRSNIELAVWDAVTTDWLGGGTFGELLNQAGERISSILDDSGELQADWHDGGRLDSLLDLAASRPSAAAIADAIWDEARSGHETAGTFGFYLDAAISGLLASGSGLAGTGNYEGDLLIARDNIARQLADMTVNPKPSYDIDGQKVDWDSHFRALSRQLVAIEQSLQGTQPFEVRTTGYTG